MLKSRVLGGLRGTGHAGVSPLPAKHNRSLLMQPQALLNRAAPKQRDSKNDEDAILIPLNYAQILGLRGREMYLDPQITTAHEDLYHADLDACYSSVARHGKEKLLGAAREGMRSARGRTALIHPDISIDFALLPGALALLEQGGHYDLVIQLAQQAQRVTARDLRTKNRSTVRDYERDVALATALAHCGLAKQALESGQTALGCARLEEALHILRETSSGGALAPELQANIATALADLKADAVLEYLTEPLDLAQVTLRQQAVAVLASMLQRPASVTSASGTSPITAEYAGRALANLTADEVCRLLDWDKAVSARAACPWWFQSLLPKVGLAHLVAGFMQRRPALVATAQRLLSAGTADGDVAVHLAVCELLLGRPMEALDVLKEDERSAAKSRGPRALSPSLPKTAFRNGAVPPFPDRDGVMAFIRVASPGGEADLLPGLCLFAEQWLQRVAFPQIRDTAERPPSATLASYFEDPQTEAFLESRDAGLPFLRRLQALVSAAGHTAASSSGRLAREVVEVASLPVKGLAAVQAALGSTWVRGLLGAAALVALIGIGMGQLGTQRRHAAQSPGGAAAAASFAAPATQRVGRQAQGKQISLAKGDAQDLVQQWLSIKVEAMGPRHATARLASVLAEPMLSAVASEAREAAASGWFWNIRPLKVRVDSVDSSNLTPEGGYAMVVATVDESADLWATNGKQGDSYKSSYRVEYSVVRSKGGWKIASALVLGR